MNTDQKRVLEYVTDNGTYYATKESNGFCLYLELDINGETHTSFISDFRDGDDFWYEIDKDREEMAYINAAALEEIN